MKISQNRGELERIREVPGKPLSRRNILLSTRETFIDEPRARFDVRKISVRHVRSMHILLYEPYGSARPTSFCIASSREREFMFVYVFLFARCRNVVKQPLKTHSEDSYGFMLEKSKTKLREKKERK